MNPFLSAEKYIQTRARKLPVNRCIVNQDWQTAGMAAVIVIRKHNNGNLTWASYLVDLLCLGIKNTNYEFNMLPIDFADFLESNPHDTKLIDIDYVLAHNIIYAGHDFAMEYGINPHPDFTNITRFLLEEDNETIETMDIPVGDERGLPHLMVSRPGEYAEALHKLKQNAGEGNYYYTINNDASFEDD